MKPLSPTMRRAISLALGHDGKLHRYESSWKVYGRRASSWSYSQHGKVSVEHRTIQSLVDRGLMEYTARELTDLIGLSAKTKPTEATLTEAGAALGREE